jgi:hypothetical protein
MHLLLFTQTLIVFVSIFFICFIYGHFFLNINKKFFIKSNLESVDFVKPVLGYSIITTVSYYLFFNFNLYLKEIIILTLTGFDIFSINMQTQICKIEMKCLLKCKRDFSMQDYFRPNLFDSSIQHCLKFLEYLMSIINLHKFQEN